MPSLGSIWYQLGIKDMTEADLQKINSRLKNLGSEITLTPKIAKELTELAVPKGVKIELDPKITNEALAKAAEGKVFKVEIMPLVSSLRKALRDATKNNPPEMEVGVQESKLRQLITTILNKSGYTLNIAAVNDNYSKVIRQQLSGKNYTIKIHADANEIARSVQTSLMQVQSRSFGLKVAKDALYRSIDEALGQRKFPITVYVKSQNLRGSVQQALNSSGLDALSYQRLQTGELRAAQAELARLRAAQYRAADAAKTHASASINLGGAMGSNIKIAGELGSAMTSLYSIHAAKEFLSQVIEIGGELEHQKIAMDTIFGDKGKTNELFGQIKGLARQSPFGVMELTKSTKALSAYGVQYNEIYDTAKRLANISAATSVDINRLILAFGKTKSRGFLDGLEAKQFAYANIPIYEMVRKKLEDLEGQAITTAQVMERIKKREIGFDIVKDVLWDMTDEGGKFYNMQEALAGSVKTSWKLVRDNIELMFGEIAESSIGDTLKDVAEVLQKLTREWRTVAAVVGTSAAAFGVYKTAVLATNLMIGKSTAANLTHRHSQAKLTASLAQTATMYRGLSSEENKQIALKSALDKVISKNILSNAALSSAEIKLLVAEKALTRDSAARLIAMGKITPMQARYLINQKLITMNDLRAAVAARKHGLSINILGKEVKIASFRFKMLAVSIRSSVNSLAVMAINPVTLTMAALGGLMAVWQKNSQQMEKAKEIGDNIFTKATEGAGNLQKKLNEIKPSKGLAKLELDRGIEEMEQAIKDYSPTPINDINDALVTQDGHVRSLADRYDVLREKVESVADAYEKMGDVSDKKTGGQMIEDAINASGDGFMWGLFNDDMIENAKDYTKALKNQSDAVRDYAEKYPQSVKTVIKSAIAVDETFAKNVKNMKNESAMLKELATHPELYRKAYGVLSSVINNSLGRGKVLNKRSDFKEDVQVFIDRLTKDIEMNWDKKISELNDKEKNTLATMLKNMITQADGVSEEVKKEWAKIFEKTFDIDLGFKLDASKAIAETLEENIAGKLDKTIIDKARKGIDLNDKEWKEFRHAVYEAYTEKFSKLDEESRQDLNAEYGTTAESQNKMASLVFLKLRAPKSNAKESGGGSNEDPELEKFKARFKDLKDAWAMYKEWQKTVGDKAAFDTVANSGLFKYIELDEIPRSVEAYDKAIQDLQKELESAGVKGKPGRESLLNEMIKTLFDVRKSVVDEQLKLALDKVSKEAEKQLADWNLYDKIQKATGNKNLAFSIAFGMDATAETDYPKLVEQNLDKQVKAYEDALVKKTKGTKNEYSPSDYTYSSLKELYDKSQAPDATDADIQAWMAVPDEIRKAWEKANGSIIKYFDQQREAAANILTEYQSLQDKIDSINAKRNSALAAVNAKRADGSYVLGDKERAEKTQLVNTQADYDIFTQSNDYLKFFNDIYGLTMSEANRIGDLIQLNLNQKLQAGLISIYEYEQQMEKVRQQLDALRNVKSDALTFLTGGIKGLSDKKLKKEQGRLANDEGYQKALKEQIAAQNALDKAKENGDDKAIAAAEEQLKLANQSVKAFTKIRDSIIKDQEKMQNVVDVANIANNIAQGMGEAFNTLRDMADSFGFDTDSNAWNTAAAVIDTMTAVTGGMSKMASSLMSGDIGGVISGAFQTVLTPFTIWNQLHDKKLQKDIERSQKQQQGYERMINAIERRMTNFLGNAKYSGDYANADPASGGAYGAERDLMEKQLGEMERQKADMEEMKKKDPEAIKDMADQIDEMKVKIKEFAMETAKDIYGIDLKDWASQLGDALFDAWKKGEDGAEAFKKKAGDILAGVMNNVLKLKLLEPMMQDVSDYLFGEDGKSGAFGKDFELTPNEIDGLAEKLMKGMEGVDAYNSALDQLEKVLNEKYGLSMKGDDDSSKSGLSAGIQGITEDTADLLASYVNAIRADVSVSRVNWDKLLDNVLPQMNVVAEAQLVAQRQIVENTLRNAEAAEAILKSNEKIYALFSRVTQGGAKVYVQ